MSSILLQILPEIQDIIFHYCTSDDLNNLSCCNSFHHVSLQGFMWNKVTVPLSSMMLEHFPKSSTNQRAQLAHTKILRFHVGILLPKDVQLLGRISHHYSIILQAFQVGNLTELYLAEAFIDDRTLQMTCDLLRNLNVFSLVGYVYYARRVTPTALKSITRIQRLKELNLHGTRLDDLVVRDICQKLPELHVFNAGDTNLTDVGLCNLVGMKNLKKLVLDRCRIGETGFKSIISLSGLAHLDIGSCSTIPTHAFVHLTQLTKLCSLNISKCVVDEHTLSVVGSLKHLRELNLMGCTELLREGSMKHIGSLTELTSLDISRTKCSDAGLKELLSLRKLLHFDVSFTDVTDEGMQNVSGFSNLRVLKTSGNNISDITLTIICKLRRLREVDLNYCRLITDHGISEFVSMCNDGEVRLECLNIHCTQVTLVGLQQLDALRSLRRIGCSFDSATIRTVLHHVDIPNRSCAEVTDDQS